MFLKGLLLLAGVLGGAVFIRSREPERPPPKPSAPPKPDARSLTPERRLWEVWKRLGWGHRATLASLILGGLITVPLVLYAIAVALS